MLFQCRASVSDGCPPLNQSLCSQWSVVTFNVLDLTIEITVVIPEKHEMSIQCCFNVVSASHSVIQHSADKETSQCVD